SLPTAGFDDFSRTIQDPWRNAVLIDLLNVGRLVLFEADTSPRGRGKYSPPRLDPDGERRYDLTTLLDGPIGEVTLVAERQPGSAVTERPTFVVTPGPSLDVCLGCPPPAGRAPTTATDSGQTLIASARLRPHQAAPRLT